MERNSLLCLVVFVISFVSLESAAQPHFEPIVKYAKDLKWGTPDDIQAYGNWENNIVSQQTENSTSAGGTYRVRITNTSKVEDLKVRVSARDLPNNEFSCLTRSMSVRVEPIIYGQVVVSETKTADVPGKWSLGGGEFPQQSCVLSASFDYQKKNFDEVRVMAQVRVRVGPRIYNQSILKNARVHASGSIVLPEPDKRIVIKELKWADPDPIDGVVRVEFKVVREGSDRHSDKIDVSLNAHYAHCPAEDASQFCYFYDLKKCGYYFFPTNIGCRSASQAIPYSVQNTYSKESCVLAAFGELVGFSPDKVTERRFRMRIPYPSPEVACKQKDEKCADLRVDIRTSAPDEDPHFHWDEDHEQIMRYHEVVK